MYNDTLTVANKIISDKDLEEIFYKMYDEMQMCEKQFKIETSQNERYEWQYQNWTVKGYSGTFKADINFYDDTNISFDNLANFMSIFNARLHEIKSIYVRYRSSYSRKLHGRPQDFVSQSINLDIYENKMRIDVDLNSGDKIMNQVYDLIKEKILSAPEKYDRIIKKKSSISNKIGFAIGAIPTIIILTLLCFVPTVREVYAMTYILFPVGCILLSLIIGNTVCGGKLDRLYENITPDKKYAGYDSTNNKRIYKDDIDSFVQSSEIIIGKNIDNIKNRHEIEEMELKYSKFIPKEIIAIVVLSIIVVIIGKLG